MCCARSSAVTRVDQFDHDEIESAARAKAQCDEGGMGAAVLSRRLLSSGRPYAGATCRRVDGGGYKVDMAE